MGNGDTKYQKTSVSQECGRCFLLLESLHTLTIKHWAGSIKARVLLKVDFHCVLKIDGEIPVKLGNIDISLKIKEGFPLI
jgi:hypothetical protein